MIEYLPALMSAVLWAVSAPVINSGMRGLPDANRGWALVLAMTAALFSGALGLGLVVAFSGPGLAAAADLMANPYVVLAGLFTFPLGTGLYYLSGLAFGGRTEIASQFAKVKPLFSVALAVWVIGESIDGYSWMAFALIGGGVLVLMSGARRGAFSWTALGIGMATALVWALGEGFVKLGFEEGASLPASLAALGASLPIMALAGLVAAAKVRPGRADFKWIAPFCLHGLISFAAAYTLFFSSIASVGLANTVLVTAFWPMGAIFASCLVGRVRGVPCRIPGIVYIAAVLLLAGSLLKIATI